jgi:hypothetical protein
MLIKDTDILFECVKNLYKSNSPDINSIDEYLKNTQLNEVLDHNSKTICEGKVSKDECHRALSLMTNDKSPGLDGIPDEFYRHFWVEIGDILIDSFNESFDNISLSEIQRCAVLSLIYKKAINLI